MMNVERFLVGCQVGPVFSSFILQTRRVGQGILAKVKNFQTSGNTILQKVAQRINRCVSDRSGNRSGRCAGLL